MVNVRLPPLCERGEDILLIARSFLSRFNRELNREVPVSGFSAEAEALLTHYAWPGNVRELENAMERAVLLSETEVIEANNLPEKLWGQKSAPSSGVDAAAGAPLDLSLKRAMRELEETFIRAALRRTKGNRTRAAELLELSHRALLYKIKEYGIDADAEGER